MEYTTGEIGSLGSRTMIGLVDWRRLGRLKQEIKARIPRSNKDMMKCKIVIFPFATRKQWLVRITQTLLLQKDTKNLDAGNKHNSTHYRNPPIYYLGGEKETGNIKGSPVVYLSFTTSVNRHSPESDPLLGSALLSFKPAPIYSSTCLPDFSLIRLRIFSRD